MAGPAFAGRRARSRSGQLAAFGAAVLVVTVALTTIGGAILPMLDAGSRELISQQGATAAAMRVQAPLAADADAADAADQDDELRTTLATALRDQPARLIRTVTVDVDAVVNGEPQQLQLLADPDLPDAAELVSGEWPGSPDEVAVNATTGLRVGDSIGLGDREVRVVGTWRAVDAAAPRWFSDPAIASGEEQGARGPVLVDEGVIIALDDSSTVRWTLIPDPASLGVSGLAGWADAMARLDTAIRRIDGRAGVTLSGSVDDAVTRATGATSVAGGIVGVPLVLVAFAGALVLALIARATASARAGEFSLLRARGGSQRSLAAAAAREAFVIALLAAALGASLAFVLLMLGLPMTGSAFDPPLALLVVIPLLVVVVATVLATAMTVAELRAPVSGRDESGRAAVVASVGPLVLVGIAAGLAYAQFASLGSPVILRPDGVVRTDPVALAAPVLLLLAGALAAPVVAGPVVAVAERVAATGRGILPVLPLRQLSRRTRSVGAGILVVALAVGAIALAVQFQVGAAAVREQAERAATGADVRVVLPGATSVTDGVPGASGAMLDGVPGVQRATAVLATTASVGGDPIPFVAADAAVLSEVRSAPHGLAALVPALIAERHGTAFPSGAGELTVTVDVATRGLSELSADVVAWLSDADGAALRVRLGALPLVNGQRVVAAAVPPTATSLLAVEVRSPTLPSDLVIDVRLDGVRAGQSELPFDGVGSGTLASGENLRFLPWPPTDSPLPVVVGVDLAEHLGLRVGRDFTFRVSGVPEPLPATVVAVMPTLPGQTSTLSFALDLATLESRAVAGGGSVPAANQLWVTSTTPDATVGAIRDVLTERAGLVAPRTFSPGPVIDRAVLLIAGGVAVTVLLAILGFTAVAVSLSQRRRAELTPLRSLGLGDARTRSARVIELATTAVIAVLLGAVAGLLTAILVVPGLTGVLS